MEGAAGAAAEHGGGFDVLVGSARSFLDGEGVAVLRRAWRWSQHWNRWVQRVIWRLWKGWGGLGSLERTHKMLEGRSEVGVVVCNGGNFSGFVWVYWV